MNSNWFSSIHNTQGSFLAFRLAISFIFHFSFGFFFHWFLWPSVFSCLIELLFTSWNVLNELCYMYSQCWMRWCLFDVCISIMWRIHNYSLIAKHFFKFDPAIWFATIRSINIRIPWCTFFSHFSFSFKKFPPIFILPHFGKDCETWLKWVPRLSMVL